jgi:peptidoglycan-associated lipoprotein
MNIALRRRTTMRKTTTTLLATAALIAIAGCTRKPPADLPPPPPTTGNPSGMTGSPTTSGAPGAAGAQTPGGVGSATVPGGNGAGMSSAAPGTRADLVAQAGTDTVHFATDSADLDSDAQTTMAKHVAWLQKYPSLRVTVEGHCDERGTREYNLALGDRRANAAKNFLVNAGISAARISLISYGKERPTAQGSDEDAWAQNRRAVTVVPM